jgi:hypothetical protein
MPVSNWSNREMLEVQFRKHIRKGVNNAAITPTWRSSKVPESETVIVEVITKQSIGVPFTETGFLPPNYPFLRYEDVQEVHWISPNKTEVLSLKQTHSDRLTLKLKSGRYLTLDGLGPAFHPVMRFFEWVIPRQQTESKSKR